MRNRTEKEETARHLLSGNEAVAYAALRAAVDLGTGYPGTPSTEILETFAELGGRAQWSPNEKVALEVAIGAAFGGAKALCTMKHVGLNVAADPFFSAAYTGVDGALVIVSADEPGMASSQNEQDNRRYAVFAGVPMLEPADSQEAFDFTLAAFELSQLLHGPVLLRLTTRVCHSKAVVEAREVHSQAGIKQFIRDIPRRVMIPAHARQAHRRMRQRLQEAAAWNESFAGNFEVEGSPELGVITSGVSYLHLREARPDVSILKLGSTYPLPLERIRRFRQTVKRCFVLEEGDPWLAEMLLAAGINVESKAEGYRFGEFDVQRVKAVLSGAPAVEKALPKGKPPELCAGCPHRKTFEVLRELNCTVIGDIGCYTLGALPPFQAMDSQLCMGASIGMGAGLRHVLPEEEARRVVSVIGDSTFVHSGITGLIEAVYNKPKYGHTVIILDNSTTAMTGLQEHPASGRSLNHEPAVKLILQDLAAAAGADSVVVVDPLKDTGALAEEIKRSLGGNGVNVIICRRECLLALKRDKQLRAAREEKEACANE